MNKKVFISYSHKDSEYLDKLHEHLSALRRQGLIETWTDREIHAGSVIDLHVIKQLDQAEICLLLISSAFIDSQYCFEREFARALKRHKAGKAIIVPIIVRDCDWNIPELRQFKALPYDGKAVSSRHWHSIDEGFANVCDGLRKLLESQPTENPKEKQKESSKVTKEKFLPDERHISSEQRAELRKIADEIVERLTVKSAGKPTEILNKKKGQSFGTVWKHFNERFETTEYGLQSLLIEQFEEAKSWLRQYRGSKDKNLKRANPQKYRDTLTKAIYTLCGNLEWSKDQLYSFATSQLSYSSVIESLNDLGNNQLELIRDRIRYEVSKRRAKTGQAKARKKPSDVI